MRALNRRGTTLLELLLVCAIAIILAGLVTTVVMAAGRSARRQSEALRQQRSLAAVAAWWRADLRDSEAADLTLAAADRFISRHPVGAGVPCQVSGVDLAVAERDWRSLRDPVPGRDELWLLTDVVAGTWVTATLVGVGTTTCPDGSPALRFTLAVAVPVVQLVRAVEPLLLRHYLSAGDWWLGLAPADGSAVVQPFAGPFDPATTRFAMDSSGVHVFVQPAGGSLREFLGPVNAP